MKLCEIVLGLLWTEFDFAEGETLRFLSFAFMTRGDMTRLLMGLDVGVAVVFYFYMTEFLIDYGEILAVEMTKFLAYIDLNYGF